MSQTPESKRSFLAELGHRRVPQLLGLYLGISWGLIQFVDWLVDSFQLSPHLSQMTFFATFSLLPAVLLLIWFHGAPGRDRWGKVEAVGLPLNLLASVVLLFLLFQGKELGATTRQVVVTDENGQQIERQVPKASFRRQLGIFPFENTDQNADLDWLQHGLPVLLRADLAQNPYLFLRIAPSSTVRSRLQRAGFDRGLGAPLTLLRQIAERSHLHSFVTGSYRQLEDGQWQVELEFYPLAGKQRRETFAGEQLLPLVDRVSAHVVEILNLPTGGDLATDLPVAERFTDSLAAAAAYSEALIAETFDNDYASAAEHLERAIGADPGFATAHVGLADTWTNLGDTGKAAEALDQAFRHDYRLSERQRFEAKGMRYFLDGEVERRTALFEMWVELYPDDVWAWGSLAAVYLWSGNRLEDALAVYEKIYQLDPGSSWVLLQSARLWKLLSEPQKAIESYELYRGHHPEEHWLDGAIGDVLRDSGDLEGARKAYEKSALLTHDQVSPVLSLAEIDLAIGEAESAARRLDQAAEIARDAEQDRLVLFQRILYLATRGQNRQLMEVLPAYQRSLDESASPVDATISGIIQTASYWVDAGHTDELLARLGKFKQELTPPFNRFADWGYMLVYARLGELDQAETYLHSTRQLMSLYQREDMLPLLDLVEGHLLLGRDRPAEAIELMERAAEGMRRSLQTSVEGEIEVLLGLAEAQRRAGQLKAAAASLARIFEVFPAQPKAHVEQARLRLAAGKPEEARHHLELALDFWRDADADFAPAQEARALLGGN